MCLRSIGYELHQRLSVVRLSRKSILVSAREQQSSQNIPSPISFESVLTQMHSCYIFGLLWVVAKCAFLRYLPVVRGGLPVLKSIECWWSEMVLTLVKPVPFKFLLQDAL